MGHSTNKSIKFSKEELELIEKAVLHHNKLIVIAETDASKLIRAGALNLAKEILRSSEIKITGM